MFRIKKRTRIGFLAFAACAPLFLQIVPDGNSYLDILVFVGIYTLITIGLSLLMGYAGQISLGHAAFFGIGAYVSGILTVHYGWNPWFSLLCGIVVCVGVAFAIGIPALRLQGHYLAMGTLAFGIVVFIVFSEETEITGGPDGMGGIPGLGLFGFEFDSIVSYYYLVWTIVAVVFLLSVNLIQSKTGRALRAIHSSPIAAGTLGINVPYYKAQIFVYSAVLASIAGSLYAHYVNFINPGSFDISFSIHLIIMIVVGGMHSIWGAVLGALLITFLSFEWLEAFHEFEVLAFGAILLLATVFFPEGLVSIPEKCRDFLKGR